MHVRSANPDALPLILTHGWPGSFLEFLDVIRPLAENFHLVIPSIPGFGFSGPTHERGWDIHRVARAWAELMRRLGYERYGAQGGDFGSGDRPGARRTSPRSRWSACTSTTCRMPPPNGGVEFDLDEEDTRRVDRIKAMMANRPAYQALQATRPQTIAYALTDSPVGQLAWIAEKFAEWTDPASDDPDDQLLTNVSLYWLTGTAGSSARLTKESAGTTPPVCAAPLGSGGAAARHHAGDAAARRAARTRSAQWTEFERGGHFAALEVPDLFAADVTRFFQLLQS